MKIRAWILFSSIVFLSACAGLQVGSDFAAGRHALLTGHNETALAYFQRAAEQDPTYAYGTAYRQNVWSYVGRTQYALGRLPDARDTLKRALNTPEDTELTRLYLGLALAKSGDRESGLKEMAAGMKGIQGWLDYINEAHRVSFGQYWDPARDIRTAIEGNLAALSSREIDLQKIISQGEWIAQRMEEEGDKARRDEAEEQNRENDGGDTQP